MWATSYDKEGSKLFFPQSTYTDEISCDIISTTMDPRRLEVQFTTKSGTGVKQNLILTADTIIPRLKKLDFKLVQIVEFVDVTPGDFYTLEIEAVSKGENSLRRKHECEAIAYPAKPDVVQSQILSTYSTIHVEFFSVGVRHQYVIT